MEINNDISFNQTLCNDTSPYINIAWEDKICSKCGKSIKKLNFYYPVSAIKNLYPQIENEFGEDGVLCQECYSNYLIENMDKLGISVVDENGEWKDFADVIRQFMDVWDKMAKK